MEIIENKDPQLLLSGRLQVSIAHEAVDVSGVNPELAQELGSRLLAHEKLSDGIKQDNLKVRVDLNTIQPAKQDILAGLEHVKNGRYHREKRVDASLLLDVLYEEWGSKPVEEIDFYKYTMEKADNDLGVAVCTLEKDEDRINFSVGFLETQIENGMSDDQFSGMKVSLAITRAIRAAVGEDSVLHDSIEYESNMTLWKPILNLIKEGKDIPCLWYYLQNGSEYKESALSPFIGKRKYETMRGLFQASKERLEELSVAAG